MGEWQYGKNGFEYKDNSEEISDLMKAAIHKALIRIGMQAESFLQEGTGFPLLQEFPGLIQRSATVKHPL